MTKFQDEHDYQDFIVKFLTAKNGFRERAFPKDGAKDGTGWRREFAMDTDLLIEFLESSQPDVMAALKKVFKAKWRETLLQYINREACKSGGGGLLDLLKHGVEVANHTLSLMYRKPEHPKVVEQAKRYAKNIYSVAKEVWASDKERVDLVVFVNGLAVATIELKCNTSKQGYIDAVNQYKDERSPETRLFFPQGGALVNFAMDLDEVYMTTRLAGEKTAFLPFNRGRGKGVNTGKGNNPVPGKYAVCYMWEDILTKDTLTELVMKFMFYEEKDERNDKGKLVRTRRLIFPRFHQLDCVRRLLSDVRENGTIQNYLIQHSTGSGKTNTIAWLAHRLASLHAEDGRAVDDNVIIVTDRVIVDRQLQKAVLAIEHQAGLIQVMGNDRTSEDLVKALNGNTKIIATTIQKFPYIVDYVKSMEGRHFGVIIDEAHSSTSGKDMIAVTKSLGLVNKLPEDATPDEIVQTILRKHGKQKNVSMFAFTATPKAETLQLFGTLDENGHMAPFHLYSMKQAIEEGFILDVLRNFVGYETHFEIIKKIEDDPFYKQRKAKSKIVRFALNHPKNVEQRCEVILEHFHSKVMGGLDGQAKAMVVTSGRREAVAYWKALRKYVADQGWQDVGVLVAFSGSVKVDGKDCTEAQLNGFAEKALPSEFDKPKNRILVVANKYQTGFDQPKLCAMYVMKGLSGIAAVQTLSRLNRICKPHDKRTFILDFVNSSEDIVKAFAPYYTTTILADTVSPGKLYGKLAEIERHGVLDDDDVCETWKLLCQKQTEETRQQVVHLLDLAKERYLNLDEDRDRKAFLSALGTFTRWYEFIVQASHLNDVNLYRKYRFIDLLGAHLQDGHVVEVIDLKSKIDASDFEQVKVEEIEDKPIESKPEIKIADSEPAAREDDIEERLSKIIADINSRYGVKFNAKVGAKSLLQVREVLLANPKLVKAARANPLEDFRLTFYKVGENAIADSNDQSREMYDMLLKDKDLRTHVLDALIGDVYRTLKAEPQGPRKTGAKT